MAHAEADMLREQSVLPKIVCHRDSITDARPADWMEWQACYASGASDAIAGGPRSHAGAP